MELKEVGITSQITTKEILEEAYKQKESKFTRPQQTIQDLDELQSFQQAKRKEYEQQLNKNRLNYGEWLRYARWEVQHNHDFPRARSILERALDVNNQHIPFWISYIQLELSHKNINHARNLLERAVKMLPRVNKLWFLYVQTEESLKNYQMVRNVFERWLQWYPEPAAWDAYISFETRYEEYDDVRNIFIRYIQQFPEGETWNKWVDFELENSENINSIRAAFESGVDTLLSRVEDKDHFLSVIISKWVDWEVSCDEFERARKIFDLLIGEKSTLNLPDSFRDSINELYTRFEKLYGTKDSIQSSTSLKRKERYESDVRQDPTDYDSWWKYITLVQASSRVITIRETFKKALSNIPSDKYKSIKWRRYIMLWVRFALWEEIENGNIEGAREAWEDCLKIIPHKSFTFGKVWRGICEFELRNSDDTDNLSKARKILGRAIGQTSSNNPKTNIFNYYINFEIKLGEFDRVRLLFEKWLEVALTTSNSCLDIVKQYVEFEQSLGEYQRCESILLLCLDLSNNKTVKASFQPYQEFFHFCVEFFKDEMKYDEIRKMYRDLLEKSPVPSNWISFALFESSIPSKEQLEEYLQSEVETFEVTLQDEQLENTRNLFEEAEEYFKQNKSNEDRLVVIEAWKNYEEVHGDNESITRISNKIPTIVKKTRNIDGIEEEYLDYVFPEDKYQDVSEDVSFSINKFLANAKKWAQQSNEI